MSRNRDKEDTSPLGGPAPTTGDHDRIAALEAALREAQGQLARIAEEAQAVEQARIEAEEEQARKIEEAVQEAFDASTTYAYVRFGDGSTLNARIPMGVLCDALVLASPTKGSTAISPTATKAYHGTPETLATRSGAARALNRAEEIMAAMLAEAGIEVEAGPEVTPEQVAYHAGTQA